MDDYVCDECYVEMDFLDVGYLGVPLEQEHHERCDPFMALQTLCKGCYNKKAVNKK